MEEQSSSETEAKKPFPDAVCPDGSAQYKCGWITGSEEDENSYYIKPGVDLSHSTLSYADLRYASLGLAHLSNADLRNADLSYANLSGANLGGVKADSSTTCPNRIRWGTAGSDCGF